MSIFRKAPLVRNWSLVLESTPKDLRDLNPFTAEDKFRCVALLRKAITKGNGGFDATFFCKKFSPFSKKIDQEVLILDHFRDNGSQLLFRTMTRQACQSLQKG